MNNKILVVCTTDSMIWQFLIPHIQQLVEHGFIVECACSRTGFYFDELTDKYGLVLHEICFKRKPFQFQNYKAYCMLCNLIKTENFNIIHCHEPVGGALGRLAGKRCKKYIMYFAHGFHFFKGAPFKNWLLYFPIEWLLAFWTDELITINKEDYTCAKKYMHARHVTYIPGIGIDLKKYSFKLHSEEDIKAERTKLGVDEDEKMLLSVGELIQRKNHVAVIYALAKLANPKIKYFICGTGELKGYLEKVARDLGVTESVKLLGYRTDISRLCDCADLFVFPSLQEGLPVALMEAIASKTPVICSNIRGNTDLVKGKALFDAKNISQISDKIDEYLNRDNSEEVERNYLKLKKFDMNMVMKEMKSLYSNYMCAGGGEVTYLERIYKLQQLRKSIGIPIDAFMLLSVGELQDRKNHRIVLEACREINIPYIYYVIAGDGELMEEYRQIISSSNMSDSLFLLGYRTDIKDLCLACDCFVHPSIREGLGIAPLEAMACGLPLISSYINGIKDYTEDGVTGCCINPRSVEEMKAAIMKMYIDEEFKTKCGYYNAEAVKTFSIENVQQIMNRIYKNIS